MPRSIARRVCELTLAAAAILGLWTAGQFTHPAAAFAANSEAPPTPHLVTFESKTAQTLYLTAARTVGDFLKERGITPVSRDYISPSIDMPIVSDMRIEYDAAVPVTLVSGSQHKNVVTSAPDVGAFLEEQGVQLGEYDTVSPSLSDPVTLNKVIRVSRIRKWLSTQKIAVPPKTLHELDLTLAPRQTKIVRKGAAGQRLAVLSFVSTDGKISKRVLVSHLLRKANPRIVAEGVATYASFSGFVEHGMRKTAYMTASALSMVATAYTAECAGCSGYTAIGVRAGRGIVAVDPSIIPLGTRLYIPGYGFAIAGDTGGAIHGYRIDLGFNSESEAIQFGRRPIVVYTLR